MNLMSALQVTRPSRAMRELMLECEVGDDVMGEDPTVAGLEAAMAATLGKEAALFVPSGTMGNIVSLAAHCGRGDEIIIGQQSHIFCHEAAAASALLGVGMCPLRNEPDGTLDLAEVRRWIRIDDPHCPRTALIALENTHNLCGGKILPLSYINAVAALAREHNLKLHVDGARLFNAVVGSGVSAQELLRNVDSVSVCLSKGLGTPVGSVVAGTRDFIYRARRARKMLGGGMRQAGVLAVCGIYALEHNIARLAEDHAAAAALSAGLGSIPQLELAPAATTNILFFTVRDSAKFNREQFVAAMAGKGVQFSTDELSRRIRAITHLDVSAEQINMVVQLAKEAVAELEA